MAVKHISAEAIETFRKIRQLEDRDGGVGPWEEEGGRRREWYNLRGQLHALLGRNAGDANVCDCNTPTPGGGHLPFDDHYREAHQLFLELARAVEATNAATEEENDRV